MRLQFHVRAVGRETVISVNMRSPSRKSGRFLGNTRGKKMSALTERARHAMNGSRVGQDIDPRLDGPMTVNLLTALNERGTADRTV